MKKLCSVVKTPLHCSMLSILEAHHYNHAVSPALITLLVHSPSHISPRPAPICFSLALAAASCTPRGGRTSALLRPNEPSRQPVRFLVGGSSAARRNLSSAGSSSLTPQARHSSSAHQPARPGVQMSGRGSGGRWRAAVSARWRSARQESRRHSSVKKRAFRSLVKDTGWQQGRTLGGLVPDSATVRRSVTGSQLG